MRYLLIALLLASCAASKDDYIPRTYIDVPANTPAELAAGVESVWQGLAREALDECYGKVDDGSLQTKIGVDNRLVDCMAEKGFVFRIVREKKTPYEK